MANMQLSEFEEGQIVAYNYFGLPLYNIARKLNHHHSSIKKILEKAENYHQKEDCSCKSKTTASDANR